jgi:hypothetical protein
MNDNTDIAARTQRFREAVRAFTPPASKRYAKLMPMKEGIIELRDKGASLRLIRELLLTVDVSVSIDTIARFLAEMNGERSVSRRVRQSRNTRSGVRQSNDGQSTTSAPATEKSSVPAQTVSPPQTAAPSERTRTRGPRIADPRNL